MATTWQRRIIKRLENIETDLDTLVALVADSVDRRPPRGVNRSPRSHARVTSGLRLIRGGLRRQLEEAGGK